MPLVKPPNAQLLVSEWARLDPDILASPIGSSVYTELPAGFKDWPAVRLTRVGGAPPWSQPLVLDEPVIQVDVWGGPKIVAEDCAELFRAAAAARLPGEHRTGIVYRVSLGALMDLPDTTYDPARPRYIFDMTLLTRAPLG